MKSSRFVFLFTSLFLLFWCNQLTEVEQESDAPDRGEAIKDGSDQWIVPYGVRILSPAAVSRVNICFANNFLLKARYPTYQGVSAKVAGELMIRDKVLGPDKTLEIPSSQRAFAYKMFDPIKRNRCSNSVPGPMRDVLVLAPSKCWVAAINAHLTNKVRRMVSNGPTPGRIRELPAALTKDFGMYCCLVEAKDGELSPFQPPRVASAPVRWALGVSG